MNVIEGSVWSSISKGVCKPLIDSINCVVTTPVKDATWNFLDITIHSAVSGLYRNTLKNRVTLKLETTISNERS